MPAIDAAVLLTRAQSDTHEDEQLLVATDSEEMEISAASESYAMHNIGESTESQWHQHDDLESPSSNASTENSAVDGVFAAGVAEHTDGRAASPLPVVLKSKKEDFTTIDWARDAANEWARRKLVHSRDANRKVRPHMGWYNPHKIWDAMQGWYVACH